MKNVAIIYDSFPHYRGGIIKELNASSLFSYYFFGSKKYRDKTIETFDFGREYNFEHIHCVEFKGFLFQVGILSSIIKNRVSAVIFLGNPYFISTWIAIPVLKLFKIKIYFWTHGWLSKKEKGLKSKLRNIFLSMADEIFLYGNRAKEIGVSFGFRSDRLHVINNSLDYDEQKKLFMGMKDVHKNELRSKHGLPIDKSIIICSARLTKKCRFDLLIEAISLLNVKNKNRANAFCILLIGDGEARNFLGEQADKLGVDVKFWGACYDDKIIAELYKSSDLTVSPGKVGLTAMHSMAFGTPVISHSNFDKQMPEFESIVPGITGDFFEENSPEDLARVIDRWIKAHPEKPENECIGIIEKYFTPTYQREIIEGVLVRDLV